MVTPRGIPVKSVRQLSYQDFKTLVFCWPFGQWACKVSSAGPIGLAGYLLMALSFEQAINISLAQEVQLMNPSMHCLSKGQQKIEDLKSWLHNWRTLCTLHS